MHEIVKKYEIEIWDSHDTRISCAADFLELKQENISEWCMKFVIDEETARREREKFLFTYGKSEYRDEYSSCRSDVLIDSATGQLTDAFFVNSDPYSGRSGSCRRTDKEMSYDRMHEIVQNEEISIGKEKRLTVSDLLELNQENWHEWCLNHKII